MKDEEMAEEYAEKQNLQNVNPSGIVRCKIADGYLAGAEFGYNKGYHDAEEHYMNVIDNQHKLVDESKAKEWHDIRKDPNDLPKDKEYVLVYTNLTNYYVAEKVDDHFMSKGWGFIPMSTVIAWCEIPTFDKE